MMMTQNEKNVPGGSKRTVGSVILYVASLLVAVIAVASLINNVVLFNNIVSQYVTQGYPEAEVLKQLVPSQLLPGIFEPVALYGGIAAILAAAGVINQKLSKCLPPIGEAEAGNDTVEESLLQNEVLEEDAEEVEEEEMTEADAETADEEMLEADEDTADDTEKEQ